MCAVDKKSHEWRRRGHGGSRLPRGVAEGWAESRGQGWSWISEDGQHLDRYCKQREWKEQDTGRVCRSGRGGVLRGRHGGADQKSGSMGLYHGGLATLLFHSKFSCALFQIKTCCRQRPVQKSDICSRPLPLVSSLVLTH